MATVLEIDLAALAHNFNYLKSKVKPGVKMLAVTKAFGYGTDAVAVAQKLESLHVDYFAVAYAAEGVALRKGGITTPILVLHPQLETFEEIITHCLEPNIYSYRVLEAFIAIAEEKKLQDYPVHIKFNTGLNRLGFKPGNEDQLLKTLKKNEVIRVKSLFSHLVASEDLNEQEFTRNQISKFKSCASKMITGLGYAPILHQSNTSGIINFEEAQFDMVRTGIGLYGYGNDPGEDAHLKPVATLKSLISQIHEIEPGESVGYNRAHFAEKPERSATIPLGHADGISREYGNGKGYVTIKGKKAPILGNVCMDMVMVDVTQIACEEGDEVIIFGKGAPLPELAKKVGSISYELLTAISQRVKRKIVNT
ncbi:alanine racemase [Flavimarina sp. Hel_I_48]|uniref:alanine racemase n=1 Tax=Flavimarina sp. Hel_I_48 TaxID=1392488 RepID=UPI0004DF5296|nr:alanine racemase [Flavimarina sp. Hel_I_48]